MIAIDRLSNDFRISGDGSVRAQATRRLDYVSRKLLADALGEVAQEFADPDGPVYRIRRLKLRLWLDMAQHSDPQIASDWAKILAQSLYRQIAEAGPDEVMHYPSQGAYLAAWITEVLSGVAADRWMYADFAVLSDLPPGQAVVAGLAQEPSQVFPALRALAARPNEFDRLISAMTARDIETLWQVWIGEPARLHNRISSRLVNSLAKSDVKLRLEPMQWNNPSARAQHALRVLWQLTQPPSKLKPEVAAPLAMQLSQLSTLVAALSDFATLWREREPTAAAVKRMMQQAPAALNHTVSWAAQIMLKPDSFEARTALLDIVTPVEPKQTGEIPQARAAPAKDVQIFTPFAGAALLLPALRSIDADAAFPPETRQEIIASLFPHTDALLARGDLGLRHMTGLASDMVLGDPPTDLKLLQQAMLDQFRSGLRGMDNASTAYLVAQFFHRKGRIISDAQGMTVQIDGIPLKVVLQLGGRLGDQGNLPWVDNTPLRIEVRDG